MKVKFKTINGLSNFHKIVAADLIKLYGNDFNVKSETKYDYILLEYPKTLWPKSYFVVNRLNLE